MPVADCDRYKVETLGQKEAFEKYYIMGDKRELKLVAPMVEKSPRTLYEWSRRFNWAERVQQRDIEIGRGLEKKTISAIIDEKANYRKIIKATIGEFLRDFKDGKVKIKSIQDLERVIKLDLILMGEASEITKLDNNMSMTAEDREAIKIFGDSVRGMMSNIDDLEE